MCNPFLGFTRAPVLCWVADVVAAEMIWAGELGRFTEACDNEALTYEPDRFILDIGCAI